MITITRAKLGECQEVRALEQTVWEEECVTGPYDAAFFVRFGYVFVAKERSKIVGAIVAIKTKDDEIKIIDWVVNKKYRCKGVGTKLYKRLKKEVKGIPLIAFVEALNETSVGCHKRLGFKTIKKIKDPFFLGSEGDWLFMKNYNS